MLTTLVVVGMAVAWVAGVMALCRLLSRTRSSASLPVHTVPVRTLEGRIVLCANCEAKTTLYTSSSGSVVCGACGSPSWMFEIPVRSLGQVVKPADEIRQLAHWYKLMPNDLPLERREQWVADVKARAEARVGKANREGQRSHDAKDAKGGAVCE